MGQATDTDRDWNELTGEEQDAESRADIARFALSEPRPGDLSRLALFAEEASEHHSPELLEQCLSALARMVLELRGRVAELEATRAAQV